MYMGVGPGTGELETYQLPHPQRKRKKSLSPIICPLPIASSEGVDPGGHLAQLSMTHVFDGDG